MVINEIWVMFFFVIANYYDKWPNIYIHTHTYKHIDDEKRAETKEWTKIRRGLSKPYQSESAITCEIEQ